MKAKAKLVFMAVLLSVCLLGVSCAFNRDFDDRLDAVVKSYRFSTVRWQLSAGFEAIKNRQTEKNDGISGVAEYFANAERIKKLKSETASIDASDSRGNLAVLEAELSRLQQQNLSLAGAVERALKKQMREVVSEQGIFNPIDKYISLKLSFPPVHFKLAEPPHLLVVSPRDRIQNIRGVSLRQNLNAEEAERIEAGVDKLGVSSLVVPIGGFAGAYPTFVTDEGNLRFTLDTVAEEWLHQYLTFTPLGFRYLLSLTGISRNYEIATMNETVAGMVSREISSIVLKKYYADIQNDTRLEVKESGFDFNREMREIRQAVDELLARGEIETAEKFMEQKRQYLAAKGYHIRKLNQAYFAFYGTYADRPTSISPIGRDLRTLRERSASLRDFLAKVSAMTSRQDLQISLEAASVAPGA